jgi:hypothetical protein
MESPFALHPLISNSPNNLAASNATTESRANKNPMCFDFTVATEDIEHSLTLSFHGKLQQTGRDSDAAVHKQLFERAEDR